MSAVPRGVASVGLVLALAATAGPQRAPAERLPADSPAGVEAQARRDVDAALAASR